MTGKSWLFVAFIVFTLFRPLPGFAQESPISDDLQALMDAASEDEQIPILIFYQEHRTFSQGERASLATLTKSERQTFVAREVVSFARQRQASAMALLRQAERQNQAARVRSLEIVNAISGRVTKAVINSIAQDAQIRLIKWDRPIPVESVLDDGAPEASSAPVQAIRTDIAWGVDHIGAPAVWNMGFEGEDVLVAVLDNGFDYNHPDLKDHLWDGSNLYYDHDDNSSTPSVQLLHHGWDTVDADNDPIFRIDQPLPNHGTQAAGIVAGDGTEGTKTGVAPEATLMLIRNAGFIENPPPTPAQFEMLESDLMAGFNFLLRMKDQHGGSFELPDIITMSASIKFDFQPNYEAWRVLADQILALDFVHTNSIGNDGTQKNFPPLNCVGLPNDFPTGRAIPYNIATPGNVPSPWMHPDQPAPIPTSANHLSSAIAVGATDANDDIDPRSSQGPAAWEDITSLYLCQNPIQDIYWDYRVETAPGNENGLIKPDIVAPSGVMSTIIMEDPLDPPYANFGGTSSATPHAAGMAALMLSADPTLTPEDVARIVQETAVGDPGKDNVYGAGRIDAYQAVIATLEEGGDEVLDDETSNVLGGTHEGKDIWVLGPTTITGSLDLFQDASGNPTDVYVVSTLEATPTADVNCEEGAEFIERGGGVLTVQPGAQIDMNCRFACMLAEQEGTIRYKSGVTQSFSNEAFLWNAGGIMILEDNAVITYQSDAEDLLVEPGSEFQLFGSGAMQLQRSVQLQGEAGNPVRFTQGGTVHVAGTDAVNTFEHVSFETTDVIVENGASVTFTESEFTNAALTIQAGADVTMTDGTEIRLQPGFHAQPGSNFHAFIDTSILRARLAQAQAPVSETTAAQAAEHQAETEASPQPRTGTAEAQEPLHKATEAVPTAFSLSQNYPNPFNPTTTITYALKEDVQVRLTIYNVLGQQVTTLVDGFQQAGYKSAVWDGRDAAGVAVPSGAYVYRLVAGDFVQARTMLLVR